MPKPTATAARPARTPVCQTTGIHRASPNQISAAAADPQVPGPGRIFPAPKNVATRVAQSGAGATACPSEIPVISLIISCVAKLLNFDVVGILHRRGYDILSAGPFAQVNGPAAFTAEREVLGSSGHGLFADRAFRFDFPFPGHQSIVDGDPDNRVHN